MFMVSFNRAVVGETIRAMAAQGDVETQVAALQGDLVEVHTELDNKASLAQGQLADTAVQPGELSPVAFTGDYADLVNVPAPGTYQGNADTATKLAAPVNIAGTPFDGSQSIDISYLNLTDRPTGSLSQVNSDWNATSGVEQILNKPTLGTAASHAATDFATAAEGAKADTAVQPGALARVATTGSYTDLINKPAVTSINWGMIGGTIGSQADLQTALSGKATAAQGAKADTALQDIVAGAGISINKTNPLKPVITSTGVSTGNMNGIIDVTQAPYNAVGDGATDNTTALQNAINDSAATRKSVWIPGGIYVTGTLLFPDNVSFIGNGSQTTALVQKAGVSTGLLKTTRFDALVANPSGLNNLNITIEGMTLDGNRGNSTGGTTMGWGSGNPRMIDVLVRNSPGIGIYTANSQYGSSVSGSPTAFVGMFRDVYVNAAWYEGWYHSGPSDMMTSNLWVTDCGRATDNGYAGIRLHGSAIKMSQTHVYMGTSGNRMKYSIWLESGGNIINNSHFEGAYIPVCIQSGGNAFSSDNFYYAAWGDTTVLFTGVCVGNTFEGNVTSPGATSQGANGNTTGIKFTSASTDYIAANKINVSMSGQKVAPINFGTKNAGGNVINIVVGDTSPSYAIGTPAANDLVDIVYLNGGQANYSNSKPVAMVNFKWNGSSIVINRAINIANVVRTGPGAFTIYFARAVPLALVTTAIAAPSLHATIPYGNNESAQTIYILNNTGFADPTFVSAVFFAP